jgi:hypothetical protein
MNEMKDLQVYVPENESRWFIRQMVFVEGDVRQTVKNYLHLASVNPVYLRPEELNYYIKIFLETEVYREYKLWILDRINEYKWNEKKAKKRGFINIHSQAYMDNCLPKEIVVNRCGNKETVTLVELKFITQLILYHISIGNGYCLLHRNYFLCKGTKVKKFTDDGTEVEELDKAKTADSYKKYTKRTINKNKLYMIFKILHENDIIRCVSLGPRQPRLFCVGDKNPYGKVSSIKVTPMIDQEMQDRFGYDYYADYKKQLGMEGLEEWMKSDADSF